jgi:hypothetical protein
MLQANPRLSPAQVKNILAQTAILDTATGTLPSQGTNTWGHGKINAYAAVKAAAIEAGIVTIAGGTIDCKLYPNPNTGRFTLDYTAAKSETLNIEIYDISGAKVYEQNWKVNADSNTKTIDLSQLSTGLYLAKVSSAQGSTTIKVSVER